MFGTPQVMMIAYIASLAVAFAIVFWRRLERDKAIQERDTLQAKLDKLQKKSQLEQDIELATTEQLMGEMANRLPGFILLMPAQSNKNETSMQIHIKGLPPQGAIHCMSMACHIISTQQPSGFGPIKEHDE